MSNYSMDNNPSGQSVGHFERKWTKFTGLIDEAVRSVVEDRAQDWGFDLAKFRSDPYTADVSQKSIMDLILQEHQDAAPRDMNDHMNER